MIELVLGEEQPARFNPVTGEYEKESSESIKVACMANYVTQQKVFEQYGDRKDRVLIARFQQEQPVFSKAYFDDRTFKPIEAIDAPVKGAVRLREVSS